MSDQPARPRGPRPSVDRRRAMLAAAVEVFGRRGVEAATTREVAAAAGTTERTLFKHFGSKQGLVQAVLEAGLAATFRRPEFAALADPGLDADGFFAWHRTFLASRIAAVGTAAPALRLLMFEALRDEGFRARAIAIWLEQVHAPLLACLSRLQARAEISCEHSPAMLAQVFASLNMGYLVTRTLIAPERGWDSRADVDGTVAAFRSLCRKDAADAPSKG